MQQTGTWLLDDGYYIHPSKGTTQKMPDTTCNASLLACLFAVAVRTTHRHPTQKRHLLLFILYK